MAAINNNGSRFWKWRKVDVLIAVGLGLIVYGAVIRDITWALLGLGSLGGPVAARGDKP